MPQWLPILSWASFILGLATAAVIAIDVTRHPQRITDNEQCPPAALLL